MSMTCIKGASECDGCMECYKKGSDCALETCGDCGYAICSGDSFYKINKSIVCSECIGDYKQIA